MINSVNLNNNLHYYSYCESVQIKKSDFNYNNYI